MESLHTITRSEGVTAIVNLHQVDFAREYASRIVGIKDGRIVFDGPPAELTEAMAAYIYEGREAQMTLEATPPTLKGALAGAAGA